MPERNRDGRYLSIGAPATFVDHLRPDGVVRPLGIPAPP